MWRLQGIFRQKWIIQAYDAFDGQPVLKEYEYDYFLRHWSHRAASKQALRYQAITDQMLKDTNWRVMWQVDEI